jgi:serine protease SohB
VGEAFAEYGVFVLELLTVIVLIVGAVLLVIAASKKSGSGEGLQVRRINDEIDNRSEQVQKVLLDRDRFRRFRRDRARQRKAERKADSRRRLFVLDFKGDIRASATASLREEVSAVLSVAEQEDEVVLRLENAGGAVHEHGLGASQLLRLKAAGLRLTVVVDKVAASGGYLMASVADRIVAAPFAIVGSIGVIAQLPNFHRFLEQRGIDFEQVTAGRFKRTLTLFGENTEEGRDKLKEELEDVHALFKSQIADQRPQIELDRVATGEHWYGTRALELGLIDELGTSDDLLREAAADADLFRITWRRRKTLPEKLRGGAESLLGG